MRCKTSVACEIRNSYGRRRESGGQRREYAMPAWAETLVSTVDRTSHHQSGKMQDLLHQFQALCAHRDLQGAIDVLLQMGCHGQFPCERDYVCLLKACGRKKALTQTKQIQAYFERHSSKISTLLKESLIIVLVKCGAPDDALHLFEGLRYRTELSWTAIIAALADFGEALMAIEFYQRMEVEGIKLSEFTFVSLLKACGSLQDLKLGKNLHVKANRAGFLSDVFVTSTLISMYGKCGDMVEAENVFTTNFENRNAVSWNAMLSAYVDNGQPEKALKCFNSMKKEDVGPTQATYAISLQACSMLGDMEEAIVVDGQTMKMEALKAGKALHDELKRKSFQSHPSVHCSLLNMYSKCGGIREAEEVFWGLEHRDVFSWTSMLTGYVVQGQGGKVLELYKEMQKEGVSPDEHTMAVAIQGCCLVAEKERASLVSGQPIKQESLDIGHNLHAEARERRYELDVFVASCLITMFSKCGAIVNAEDVFSGLSLRDSIVWNSMISAYVYHGQGEKALDIFKQMIVEAVLLDYVTLICVLQACSEVGEVEVCSGIHFVSVYSGCRLGRFLTSLIHAYGNCACILDAEAIFNASSKPNGVIWSALIAGLCREGSCFECLQSFEMMRFTSTNPDGVIFISLLSGCSHDGLVGEAVEFLNLMTKEYGLSMDVKHFVSLFDLLGRAGDFRRLYDVLSKVHVIPNQVVWLCLLSACQNHGNMEMGKFAFDCVVHLQPEDVAAHVLMSNIYANSRLYDSSGSADRCVTDVGDWELERSEGDLPVDVEETIGELNCLVAC